MCLCVLPLAAAHTEISSQTTLCWEEIVIIIIIIIIMSLCACLMQLNTPRSCLLYILISHLSVWQQRCFSFKTAIIAGFSLFVSVTLGFTCFCARLLNVLFVWQQFFIIIITTIIMTIIIIIITDDTNNNNNNLVVSPHNISSASPHFFFC